MTQAVPPDWMKVGRREYEHEDLEVEVDFLPTRDRDGQFRVRFEFDDEWTTVENFQPSETDALELAKEAMRAFNDEHDGSDDDASVAGAIERAVARVES
jgi:hypothetical protein